LPSPEIGYDPVEDDLPGSGFMAYLDVELGEDSLARVENAEVQNNRLPLDVRCALGGPDLKDAQRGIQRVTGRDVKDGDL
jgi:hypothetical protein